MRDGLLGRGSYLKGLGCLGTILLVELRDFGGLMTLVDEVNLNGV